MDGVMDWDNRSKEDRLAIRGAMLREMTSRLNEQYPGSNPEVIRKTAVRLVNYAISEERAKNLRDRARMH